MKITPTLFAEAGEAMFGPEWKRPLAELLGIADRTVFRIAKAARDGEDYPLNPKLGPTLAAHLREAAAKARLRADRAEDLAAVLGAGASPES